MINAYKDVNNCVKCKRLLYSEKTGMFPSVMLDNLNAEVLFIGQNPGIPLQKEINRRYEDVLLESRIGKMFISKFIQISNIEWSRIYWTNICKCPSLDKFITIEEIRNCVRFLMMQLDRLYNIKYIILLGKVVQNCLCDTLIQLTPKIKLINFYHPSYIIRFNKYNLLNDLCKEINV